MNLNLVVLSGRLAAPVHSESFASGARFLRFLITVTSDLPRRRVDVIPVTLWCTPGDVCDESWSVGERLLIAGSIQRRFWTDQPDKRSQIGVIAFRITRTSLVPVASQAVGLPVKNSVTSEDRAAETPT